MPALLTASGRPGFYFRVLEEGEVGAGDEIVKVGEATERMTVAEVNALLYSPDHPRRAPRARPADRGAVARVARVVRGPAAAPDDRARAAATRGWRRRRRRTRRRPDFARCGHADRSRVRGRPLAALRAGRPAADRGPARPVRGAAPATDRRRAAALPQLFALGAAVSTERYRISVKIEPNGAAGRTWRARPRRATSRRQRAARQLHPAGGRGPRGAAERGDRRDAGAGDAARAGGGAVDPAGLCGCTGPRPGSTTPSPPRSRACWARSPRGRGHVCYSRPGADDRLGGTSTPPATCRRDLRRARSPPRRRRLPLRADAVHGRHEGGARRASAWRRPGFTWSSSPAARR